MGRNVFIGIVFLMLVTTTWGSDEAVNPQDSGGVTSWLLGGSGVQELRVGYEGLLPDIEVAVGLCHTDAPDPEEQEWPVRGYLLAHALDAEMLAGALGTQIELPDGNLYGGLFCEYSHDRENEWSGGYVVGGLVDWPKGWQTCVEYGATVFNATKEAYEILLGFRRVW